MGAIAGIQCSEDSLDLNRKYIVMQMLDTIAYRGSHYQILPIDKCITLGVRYHQPTDHGNVMIYDVTKSLFVILDGEIYWQSCDKNLKKDPFSDAEIILKLYQQKGEDFLKEIDGSYAVAVWDKKKQKLLIARDRLGYKPLFYTKRGNFLIFASEIKSILVSGLYNKSVNLRALNDFLSYGYISNPNTLFESIQQVKPGHMLILNNNRISEKPYYKFSYKQDDIKRPEKYYKEKFLELFETAVLRRLKRHPNCGAFLSGGLDTSGVVAVMHKFKQQPFKVFTGGFEEEQYNEIGDAKIVSDHLNLDLQTVIVKFKEDFPQLLEKIVWHHDAPFSDTSAIPSYFAAKLAKENVNVVFTGDFPDQLIGGSGHQAAALARQRDDSLIYRLMRNKVLNSLVTHIPLSAGGTSLFDRVKRMIYRETFPLEEQRIVLNMPVPELLKRCLYTKDMLEINSKNNPLILARSLYHETRGCHLLDKLLYFDVLSYATDDLMVKVERMTMAHGLIAISPFHDFEFVDFITTLPTELKIKGEARKYIMREALRPMLPEHTLNKQKKGFDMPIEDWLIKKFPNFVREILLDSRTLNRGYFNRGFIFRMVENFLNRKTDYASGSAAAIISLITLELWHRIFIDK